MNLQHEAIHQPELKGHNLQVAEPDPGSIASEHSLEDLAFSQLFQPSSLPAGKDVAESERVAKAIKAKPKKCWLNARRAIVKLDGYADASYVEGWAVAPGWLSKCEHGWVVRNGRIVDPTLPGSPLVYFAGLEFSGRTGIAKFLATPKGRECKRSFFFSRLR